MRRMAVIGVLLLVGACAKGTSGRPRDAAAFDARTDAGVRDTGGRDIGPRDTGSADTPPGCIDDEVGDTCAEATDLGAILEGGMMVVTGKLPILSDQDWYTVAFPPLSATLGGGAPTVMLEGDATMIFEVETVCGTVAACGEGNSRELTSYSVVDDQSMGLDPVDPEGVGNDYSTREDEWAGVLHLRVARKGGPVNCDDYTLTITR